MSGLYTEGLMKRYGSRTALSDVSIHLDKGEVVGLLGPNGAGKTTCFYAITGFVRPDRGRVMLGDKDISHYPIHRRARHGLSYLPQESSIFTGLTAEENILAVLEIKGVAGKEKRLLTQKLLEDMGLEHLADVNALAFSGGERRKVEIARLLAGNPDFVLLDEPFAAIEPISVVDLQKTICGLRDKNIGIFITDHNVRETLQICDRAYILDKGQVLREGKPAEIIADETVRAVYLGQEFSI
ncbi:MAG: LPS export ABC transporter ATP-binding protein [Candidatus Zeuxoniibacter abyssi]|nr:MAG: LPS export ABC transporter ATP-binding protein [Candidatus Persebacteraceae bacterium AB1(2)]